MPQQKPSIPPSHENRQNRKLNSRLDSTLGRNSSQFKSSITRDFDVDKVQHRGPIARTAMSPILSRSLRCTVIGRNGVCFRDFGSGSSRSYCRLPPSQGFGEESWTAGSENQGNSRNETFSLYTPSASQYHCLRFQRLHSLTYDSTTYRTHGFVTYDWSLPSHAVRCELRSVLAHLLSSITSH